MNDVKVSVIIPIYKPDFWFDECIKSIANQTMDKAEYEVVLILNGDLSYRDYVHSVIDKYLKENIYQYFETDFGNVSNARNIGLDNARGEYIIFVDSDDVVSVSYIRELYIVSSIDLVGICRTQDFEKRIEDAYQTNQLILQERIVQEGGSFFRNRKCFSNVWRKCFHRDIIGVERFNLNFSIGEDMMFLLISFFVFF